MISYQNLIKQVEDKKTVWKKRLYERVHIFASKMNLEKIIRNTMMINRQYVAFFGAN